MSKWHELAEGELDFALRLPQREGSIDIDTSELKERTAGAIFELAQNTGMGGDSSKAARPKYTIMSTASGLHRRRKECPHPVSLGMHTGSSELDLLIEACARRLDELGVQSNTFYVSDPCDGISQGTMGGLDSLPYRNAAALTAGHLLRSTPRPHWEKKQWKRCIIIVATCDKGLPAMLMAGLQVGRELGLPLIVINGGVSVAADTEDGPWEDSGTIQSVGGRVTLEMIEAAAAARLLCTACGGGGCHFLGTAASNQIVAEAYGLSLPHSALAPNAEFIWTMQAIRSADAAFQMVENGVCSEDIFTRPALHNGMAVLAAAGGSTNEILHVAAEAYHGGLVMPTMEDWDRTNRSVRRIVDALPNGPQHFFTSFVHAAGGVIEIMYQLSKLPGILDLDAMTVTGETVGENIAKWETSDRRKECRARLQAEEGIDPSDVIMEPDYAKSVGMSSSTGFVTGNVCPVPAVVKIGSIDQALFDEKGIYRYRGAVRMYCDVRVARKDLTAGTIEPGDVVVFYGLGPKAAGMPEMAAFTNAVKDIAKKIPAYATLCVITDGRWSGHTNGPCIGHVVPEAAAGGPIGKLRDGDIVEVVLNRKDLGGTVNLLGSADTEVDQLSAETGSTLIDGRDSLQIVRDMEISRDIRLFGAMQSGPDKGCIWEHDTLIARLEATEVGANATVT